MLQVITAPSVLPFSVDEVRSHVKQDITADDPLLRTYTWAAARYAETQTERALMATRYRLVLDSFPGPGLLGVPYGVTQSLPSHAIQLPRSPLLQVESVQYLDMAGTLQTLAATEYVIDDSGQIPRITPPFGKIWPIPLPQIGAVRVNFIAGYSTSITANASADTLTLGTWKALAVNDVVRFTNSGGALPAPLVENVDYYVQSIPSSGVIKVSATSGGAAIDLTDTGGATGQSYLGGVPEDIKAWMMLRVDSLFTHRGETAVVKGILTPLPYVDQLLPPAPSL